MNDKMKNEIKIITEFNHDLIKQHLEYHGQYTGQYTGLIDRKVEEIIKLKEEGVKEALLKLGWKSPENKDLERAIELLRRCRCYRKFSDRYMTDLEKEVEEFLVNLEKIK